MQREISCIVCGSKNSKVLYRSTFSGSLKEAAECFLSHRKRVVHGEITRCKDCGFVYTSPQFAAEEYGLIYQMAPQEPDVSQDMQYARNARFTRLAGIVRRHVVPGRYLDFGCGKGSFLDVMNDGQGIGFEVGQPGRRESPGGAPIITGNFFALQGQLPFSEESFSFITAFDVFEHLPDLPLYIESLRRLIKKEGHIVLTVPNVQSFIAKLTGERWNMILLEHLWYFSPYTIRTLMEQHGFAHELTSAIPYSATLSHISNRFSQTYGFGPVSLPKSIASLAIPMPIGLMMCVFRRTR